jgi:gas vesicle protein
MSIKDLLMQNRINAQNEAKKKAMKSAAIGAGIGAAVGVTAGVLLAPKSGKETREELAKHIKETSGMVKEKLEKMHTGGKPEAEKAEKTEKNETKKS